MKKRSYWIGLAIIVVVLAGVLWAVFREQSVSQIVAAMRSVHPGFVVIGLFLMCMYSGFEGLCTWSTLHTLKDPTAYHLCVGYALTGFFFSAITPSSSGGQPAQIYSMTLDGVSVAHGAIAMLLNSICYQAVSLILGVLSIFICPDALTIIGSGVGILLSIGITVATILTLSMLGLLFLPRPARVISEWILKQGIRIRLVRHSDAAREKLNAQLEQYRQGAICLKAAPLLLPRLLGLTVMQLLCSYSVPCVVYLAFGLSGYPLWQMVAMQAVLNLSVGYMPLPGSTGFAEGVFLRLYTLFFGASLVAPAMLVSRGISFYCFLLISGLMAGLFQLRKKKK